MHGAASHRLELTGYVVEGRPHLVVEHDPSVLDDAAIARLGSAVVAAFAAVRGG